jgi:hypothetical protein
MNTPNPTSKRIRALSTAVTTALLAGLVAVSPASAQSGASTDASEARKNQTTKRPSASTESIGPFVYEALGATPSIRLPALFAGHAASASAKDESKQAKVDTAQRSDTTRR